MSHMDTLRAFARQSPFLRLESVWLKIAISFVLSGFVRSGLELPGVSVLWLIFIALCWSQDFAGLDAVKHWFSRYVAAAFSVLFFPQLMVHFWRRELIVGLAVFSYFFPSFPAVDAAVFIASFFALSALESLQPRVYSWLILVSMAVAPVVTAAWCWKAEAGLWPILGLTVANGLFLMAGRVCLWSYKLRWAKSAAPREAKIPEERRLTG